MSWTKGMSVTQKLQFGILAIVMIGAISSLINFYAQSKIQSSYQDFKTINTSNTLLNKFLEKLTENTLGYMDAIVDKDAYKVDAGIVKSHEEFKTWIEANKSDISNAFFQIDPNSKSAYENALTDVNIYWSAGDSMIKDINNKKVDELGKYDDDIDGKNNEIKTIILTMLEASMIKFNTTSTNLENAQNLLKLSTIFSSAAILLCSFAILYFLIRDIRTTLENVGGELSKGSHTVLNTATEFNKLSSQLKDSTNKQASAIHQTSSAVEQIKSTVERNSELTNVSVEMVNTCKHSAEKGKEASSAMLLAIEEINMAQSETITTLETTSSEVKNMMKLIEEINQKTSVINDIVFQTKLLSFNASVEAARAGEHGKGFAVVAEEVGNLAQMSGNAAQEINQLLSSSVTKVEEIVKSTESRKTDLERKSHEMVTKGKTTSKESDKHLNEIAEKLINLQQMIEEINQASKEQTDGISSISDAINNLDSITNDNVQVANTCHVSAETLTDQSTVLSGSVQTLFHTVIGKKAA